MTVLAEPLLYIEHYQLRSLMASSNFNEVHEAVDLRTNKTVVVKIMAPTYANNTLFSAQFHAAARADLTHDNIVAITDWGVHQNRPYIVMPYIDGHDLATHLQELAYHDESIFLGELLTIGIQIANALSYAHEQKNLIHRDIKPANILIPIVAHDNPREYIEKVLLTDFDLAIPVDTVSTGDTAGSRPYMSPEQQRGQNVDGRSDIFALGVILYQLTTGRLPYPEHDPLIPPIPPHEHNQQLPLPVSQIIMRAIALSPNDRYQSSSQLAGALKEQESQLADLLLPEQDGIWRGDTQPANTEGEFAVNTAVPISDDRLTIYKSPPEHRDLGESLITIGRDEHMDIVLRDPSISRRHATLKRDTEKQQWIIRNLDSRNGVYLDGTPLLPNSAEVWYAHQTLRIGPYSLQLHTTAEGSSRHSNTQLFSAFLATKKLEMVPGETFVVQLILINQTESDQLYQIDIEADFDWHQIPTNGIRLTPKERRMIPITLEPPANSTVQAGNYSYKVIISSMYGEIKERELRGHVAIKTFVQYKARLTPADLPHWLKVTELEIENESNEAQTFTIATASTNPQLRFGTPAQESPAGLGRRRNPLQILYQIPFFGSLLTQLSHLSPLRAFRNVTTRISQYTRTLSRVQSVLGSPSDMPPPTSPRSMRKESISYSARDYSFANQLNQTITIRAGQTKRLPIMIQQKKRPFIGVAQPVPFSLTIAAANSNPELLKGELGVKPRVTPRWFRRIILFSLIMLVLIFAWYANNQIRNAPIVLFQSIDRDRDGLFNAAEIHTHRTNPNLADTDGDGLTDKQEVDRQWDPLVADMDGDGVLDGQEVEWGTKLGNPDSDGDGLTDGQEIRLGTNPNSSDTDGNSQSDPCDNGIGPACPTSTPLAAAPVGELNVTSPPTATPPPIPTSAPAISTITVLAPTSDPIYDGYLRYKSGNDAIHNRDGELIILGDSGTENEQYIGILSFDTTLPADATIQSVILQLKQADIVGDPFTQLKAVEVSFAPPTGFDDDIRLSGSDFFASDALIIERERPTITQNNIGPDGTITLAFDSSYYTAINHNGVTQLRLGFQLVSNDDVQADQLFIYAGDSATNAPQLLITYQTQSP